MSQPPAPVRIFSMAWGTSVADFGAVALPALLAPGNIPWLLATGMATTWTIYTLEDDVPTLRSILGPAAGLPLTVNFVSWPAASPTPDVASLKRMFVRQEILSSTDAGARTFLALADVYYGDGTMRNLMRCANAAGTVIAVPIVRVKRQAFAELLLTHQRRSGRPHVSNAELVDLALRCPIDAFERSRTDRDENASARTSIALRELAPDLWTMVMQLPSPLLCSFVPGDLEFFERNFNQWDGEWPSKLLAERRLRYAGASDIGFLVELTSAEEEATLHQPRSNPGMRDNEDVDRRTLQSEAARPVIMTLRREPTLVD